MKAFSTSILAILLSVFCAIASAQIVYVSPAGSGLLDGSSWANALPGNNPGTTGYTRLADTLRHAISGTQFWVAEGTYLPCLDNDRLKTFFIKENVSFYGGFQGNESQITERNLSNHHTILSGDIGIPDEISDNTCTVITSYYSNAWTLFSTIDGVTIEKGNSNQGNGLGGGLLNYGKLNVSHCNFFNNRAITGGAIYGITIAYYYQSPAELNIINCEFIRNSASYRGGCLSLEINGTISYSKFLNNTGGSQGGAISLNSNTASNSIINCLIANNTATFGGGISINNTLPVKIYNSTIANNKGNTSADFNIEIWQNSKAEIYNSIVFGNEPVQVLSGGSLFVSNSCLTGSYSGSGNIADNPRFIYPTTGYGANFDATTADWRLNWCSPVINMGKDSLNPAGLVFDLEGKPRILDGNVDMGAIEFDSASVIRNTFSRLHDTIYVIDTNVYAGDGSSWEYGLAANRESCIYPGRTLLFEVLKDASPNTQIWLVKGTFKPGLINNRYHSFEPGEGVKLIGGFGNHESAIEERDTINNITVFTGEYGNSSVPTDNAYHVINVNPENDVWQDTSEILNVTISGGYANGSNLENRGAGIFLNSNAKLLLKSCRIHSNYSSSIGGGIYNEGILITKNSNILFNTSFSGGGIYNVGTIKGQNFRIDSNNCIYKGSASGIFNNGTLIITSGSVSYGSPNLAIFGGGMRLGPASNCTLNFVKINRNSTRPIPIAFGGGIYNEGLLNINHCIIDSNTTAYMGGGIYNESTGTLNINFSQIAYNSATVYVIGTNKGSAICNTYICNINNSIITNNISENGSVYNPTSISNCLIVNNESGIVTLNNNVPIVFSTIANNDHFGISGTPVSLQNTVHWNNSSNLPANSIANYSCFEGSLPGYNINFTPGFANPTSGRGVSYNGLIADWSLGNCSPLIDRVFDTLNTYDTADVYNNPRKYGRYSDIGAVERQQNAPGLIDYSKNRIYFTDSTNSNGTGLSWQTSLGAYVPSCKFPGYSLLYEALFEAPPGTEIWLKNGQYSAGFDNDREKYFMVGPDIHIFGGFQGYENELTDRDTNYLNTIFSGDIGVQGDSSDNLYSIFVFKNLLTGNSTNTINSIKLEKSFSNGSGTFASGGCIIAEAGRNVIIDHCKFISNYSNSPIIQNSGHIVFSNSTIRSNNSSPNINNGNNAFFEALNSTFDTIKSLITNNGNLQITNCTVSHTLGGGIIQNTGICNLNNNLFDHNIAVMVAAVLINSNEAIVRNCKFNQNVSKVGILLNTGTLTTQDCDFIYNKADSVKYPNGMIQISYGPAPGTINNTTGDCFIRGCNFIENASFGHGGAIYNSGEMQIDSSFFSGNTSGVVKVYVTGGMFNFVFTSNRFTGGSVSNFGNCFINDCKFSNGHASLGGAVYNYLNGDLQINRCKFFNNFSQRQGGALMNEGRMNVQNSLLFNNESGTPSLENSIICVGNGSTSKFESCVFSNNKSNYNFGLFETGYTKASMWTVVNIPDTISIINSIIWGNSGSIVNNNNSSITVNYSCVQNGWPGIGIGNSSLEPLFSNPTTKIGKDTLLQSYDYRLRGCSPCINSGNSSLVSDSLDLDGNQRIVETVDMGAYEYQTIPAGNWVYGSIEYDNADSTVVDSVLVKLKSAEVVIDSFLTRSPGEFCFSNVQPGNYTIECSSARSWGGVNSIDALLIMKHFTEVTFLNGLRLMAGSIDGNAWINAIDALLLAKRYTGIISSYSQSDWIFEEQNLSVGSSNVEVNIKALCRGDVNGSFIP